MHNKIFSFLLVSTIYSQAILHFPIEESTEKTPVLVEAFVDLPEYEIKTVTLFYRLKGEIKYIESPMLKIDTGYLGEIPPMFVQMRGLEYFLIVDTYTMGFLGLPNIDPPNNPFRVDIKKKKEYLSDITLSEFEPDFTILSPEPGIEIPIEDVMISVSYFQMDNIDNEKIKVFLNNENITSLADFRFNHFVCYPENIQEGINKVEVILVDDFSVEYNPIKWDFIAIEDMSSRFILEQSGKFKTDYTNSIVDTTSLFEKTADFIYNAKFSWMDFRTNIHLSSLESPLEQPKNRYYADFKSEFMRLRIGDVYPSFGENFIKKNRIRGIDFKIEKEKYRLNFVSGEINRSTQGFYFGKAMVISDLVLDTIYNELNEVEGLDSPSFNINRDDYSFLRKLTALNIEFPIKKTMSLGVSILKAKDNISSVYAEVPGSIIEIPNRLNKYIDNSDYLYSTDSTFIIDGDTLFNDTGGIVEILDDTTVVNYATYSNIKNNYSKLFKSSLIGEGSCIDFNGNDLVQYVDQSSCDENGGQWVLSGDCYAITIENDYCEDSEGNPLNYTNQIECESNGGDWIIGQGEVVDLDDPQDFDNQIICENAGHAWVPFFNINFKKSYWQGAKPKDNFVFGLDFKALLDNNRLKFKSGISFSLLNENTWDPVLTYESLDLLGDDPADGRLAGYEIPKNLDFSEYEDIFQTGINQVPLIPLDIISGKASLFKILTMPSLAYYLSFEGDYFGHKVSYKIKQIGPEYNTLGNIYLQKDIREQTITDKIALLDNKLYLSLRYKFLEEDISYATQEKGKTNKFDVLMNFSPGANLPRLSSAIGYQGRTNGVTSNDFIEYENEENTIVDIDSRKVDVETLQYSFALSTPFYFYGNQNITISYFNSLTDDLVADENILFSMESGDSLDVFPYISPRTQTNTFNFNLKSDFSPLISSISSYSRTFFDYGMKISEYYRVLNNNQGMFDMDSDYDFNTAASNVERFATDTNYSEILYNKQTLNSIDLELILKSYLVFDQLKYGIHFSNAKGYIDFNQYGFSISAMRSILDRFYINFNYDLQSKTVSDGNDYNNSYFIMRFGYQF